MSISLQPRHVPSIIPLALKSAEAANTPAAVQPASNDIVPALANIPAASTPLNGTFNFKQALGDQQSLKTLGQALAQVAVRLGPDATPAAVLAALKTTPVTLHRDSAAFATLGEHTTLELFIKHLGFRSPDNRFSLGSLSDAVINRAQEHPLGSLDGALGWPVPLSASSRDYLHTGSERYSEPGSGSRRVKETPGKLLGYLRDNTALSAQTLRDPASTLNALIGSPTAQRIGKYLQDGMNGIATDRSATDYLLAAIMVHLDPESIKAPERNTVAGFDLANKDHWGKPACEVISALRKHLADAKRGDLVLTDTAMAGTAAYLLLAARAPVFLIKDIPSSVTYGSPAWFNLTVAAATIEAATPGRVPNMTFAQVMLEAEGASLANPAITEDAQRSAMIDWGVANGITNKKLDHQYTADELKALVTEFNTRNSVLSAATQACDEDIPSRKSIALAELKLRFPGQEALYELKVLGTDIYRGDAKQTGLVGLHSLLDIAMMDLPNPRPFTSDDDRIPADLVDTLNKNLKFGVTEAFDTQFKKAIWDKKTAVSTMVRHLISQLPWEDRKNFAFGEITLFKEGSYKLGLGFSGTTPGPNKPGLIVKTERHEEQEGKRILVSRAYEINFNKGTIEPTQLDRAKHQDSREASRVFTTRAFKPLFRPEKLDSEQPVNTPELNSFNDLRSTVIAAAFVQHLGLDDSAIEEQARGQTTLDKLRGGPKPLSDFLLNLIPLRSAIVNIQQGNYGAAAFDLTMDVFGFLTAGAAAAGKLLKIASSALSVGTKTLRAAKVIGATILGQLNPLDGVGDLAMSGAILIGKGARKSTEWFNKLRGAEGSYDLLKAASKDNIVVATGHLKIGERTIESPAILKDGKWYAFDADQMRPYGPSLQGFTPGTVAVKGEINQSFSDWLYKKLAGDTLAPQGPPTVLGLYVPKDFEAKLIKARRPENVIDFDSGYEFGKLDRVPGYSADMSVIDLQALVSLPFMSPHDIGTLIKQIERQKLKLIQDGFVLFQKDVQTAGGALIPMPQEFYLSQINLASPGECAGMSNTLALAIHNKDEVVYLGNLFTAAANPNTPNAARFIRDQRNFHNAVSDHDTFHMGKAFRQIPYHQVASDLTNPAPPRTLRIATRDHALLAGVMVRDDKPVWFYFDPNFGLAKFTSAAAMKNGLERTLNRGTSPFQHRAFGENRGVPEYQVSYFDPRDIQTYPNPTDVTRLASTQL